MAISIWSKPAELTLPVIPFDTMMKGLAYKQQKADEAKTQLKDTEDTFLKVGSINQDTPRKKELVDSYQQELNNIYDSSKGDYAAMAPKLMDLKRKLTQDLTYGELGAIQKRYNAQQDSIKAYKDAVEEYVKTGKGMSEEDARGTLNREMATQDPLTLDPQFGTYTGYKTIGVRPTINVNKKALEYAEKITPETLVSNNPDLLRVKDKNGQYTGFLYNTKTKETFSFPDLRAKLLADALKADPEVTNYLSFKNEINGVNDALKAKYQNVVQNNYIDTDENGYPVQFNPSKYDEHFNQVADSVLNHDIYKSAQAIGNLTAVHTQDIDNQYMKDWMYSDQLKTQQENLDYLPQTENIQYSPYTDRQDPFNGIEVSGWTPSGNPIINTHKKQIIIPHDATPSEREFLSKQWEKQQHVNEQNNINDTKTIIKRAESIRHQVPELEHASIKEIYDFTQAAYQNASASFKGYIIPGIDDSQTAGRLLGNLSGKPLYVVSSAGKNGFMDLSQVAKKLGNMTPHDVETQIYEKAKQGGLKFVPVNASGKPGYLVQLITSQKTGETADIIVPVSNEANAMFGNLNAAFDAYKAGVIGEDRTRKIYSEDDGIYTSLSKNENGPIWKVGRILNHKDTQEILNNEGVTKFQAMQRGNEFTKDGRLISYDIDNTISEATNAWFNSPYMKPYFTNKKKNPVEFQQEEE